MLPQRTDLARAAGKPRLLGLLLCFELLLSGFGAREALAGTPIPYVGEFREQIEATFFEPDPGSWPTETRVSPEKVARYREHLEKKRRFLLAHVSTADRIERGRSRKKADKAARKTDWALALRVALDQLDRLEREADVVAAYEAAATLLMIEFATRSYTDPIGSVKIPVHLMNMLDQWSLPDRTRASGVEAEAGNLVNLADGSFYTREELADLVRAGSDLSELDPPDVTPFWRRKPDIAAVDIVSNYLEGGDPVHEGLVAEFPPFEGAVFELDKLRLTQSKPKLDAFYDDPGCLAAAQAKPKACRQRLKLKFGMEVHADPPANALLAALGFNVDVSMPLRNVRVYLGKLSMREIEQQWAGYFDRQRMHIYYPLHTVLAPGDAGRGRDERGEYLVFLEAVAEVKAPAIERIGYFSFRHGMASNAREARALGIFNVWIANADMKNEENNKLSLRQDAHGNWQMYLVQQDLGHSFGYVLPEKPDAYPWEVVDSDPFSRLMGKLRGRIELTYVDLQSSALQHSTTYADAKWMVRLIAQLTKEQIDTAVRLGSWPDSVAQLIVEKLANRRNDMVRAFGLEREFSPLPVERRLTTADGAVVDGDLVQSRWQGSNMRYGEHWVDLFAPVGRYLLDVGIAAVQMGAGAVDRIDPGRIRLGARAVISPEILIELDRRVTLNPAPTARFDQYIVRDTLGIGANVAAGYFASVEGAWARRFVMAYPVATRHEGLLGGNRVLSLLLPVDVRRGDLPDKYVLMREDVFAAGGRVSSDDSGTLFDVLGGTVSLNRVVRHRSVVDLLGEVPLVWVDRPEYWRVLVRGFLKPAVVEIPFAWGEIARGDLSGFAWHLDPARLDVIGADGTPVIERLVRYDDPSELVSIQLRDPTRVSSSFASRDLHWSLLFVGASRRARDETIVHATLAGDTLRVELQAQRQHSSHWRFLDNGEVQALEVTGYNKASQLAEMRRDGATVVSKYHVEDLNAHSDEFDGYYDFLAGLGALDAAVARDFDAADWEVSGKPSGRWQRLVTRASVHYRAEALERLLALSEAEFWSLLSQELGVSVRRVRRLVDEVRRRDRRLGRRGIRFARGRERAAILRSLEVFQLLASAREAPDESARLRGLVRAIERANFRTGHTFDASVVAALHRGIGFDALVDEDTVFIRGSIGRTFDNANNLPEGRTVVGERGDPSDLREENYRFFPLTGVDFYNMLGWMRSDAAVN
ncbi:MAG: hypothetical protein JRH16_04280 [Deltaproteobacteria bacterium]|nr:hypothetical protein [Deltaproteobacteria bacterium]